MKKSVFITLKTHKNIVPTLTTGATVTVGRTAPVVTPFSSSSKKPGPLKGRQRPCQYLSYPTTNTTIRTNMFTGTLERLAGQKSPSSKTTKGTGTGRFKFGGTFLVAPFPGSRFTFYSKDMPGGGISTNHVKVFLFEADDDNGVDYLFRTESGTIYRLASIRDAVDTSKPIRYF